MSLITNIAAKAKTKVNEFLENLGYKAIYSTRVYEIKALENYDKYRRFSYFLIFGIMIFFVLTKQWFCSLLTFFVLHLHILINQIWWKMVNFQHYNLKEKEESVQDPSAGKEILEIKLSDGDRR